MIKVNATEFKNLVEKLYKIFIETDASLVEINPLIKSNDSKLIALDAKMNFDSNALFRQSEIVALRDFDEEDKYELEASNYDLSYISLDGNIACMVNGAGLAMATMDTIKLFGGEPANFLDVGGGASVEKVKKAFEIMVSNLKVSVILSIFGGIMKCDVIAEGIVKVAEELNLKIPLIVRMKGTNEDLGKEILDKSALKIQSADDMESAAKMSVNATNLEHEMSILINKHTKVITQGITGKNRSISYITMLEICIWKRLLSCRCKSKKAGEVFEGIPVFASVNEAKEKVQASVSVIYVPPFVFKSNN